MNKYSLVFRRAWFVCLVFVSTLSVCAQYRVTPAYQAYIEQYAPMAVDQMTRHKIPASITLAQGLLESAAGQSMLATRANNHFGIKVTPSWTGPYVVKDDDARGEKFRSYNNAAESFEDHSLFLERARYASLFALDITDYKGWAKGLKACGYATNPAYAEHLIQLIEAYNLQRFDLPGALTSVTTTPIVSVTPATPVQTVTTTTRTTTTNRHEVQYCNKSRYIHVREGDSYGSIASEFALSVYSLCKYNDVLPNYPLHVGDIIYVDKKQKKANKSLRQYYHTVRPQDSMHSISQLYGMRLSTLYTVNKFPNDHKLKVGDKVRIR